MAILTLGIDLAKNVFALHGVNEAGKPELQRPKVARAKLDEVVAALPPCTIGIEACSGAHHWAREFAKHAHTVKLVAPKLVTPRLRVKDVEFERRDLLVRDGKGAKDRVTVSPKNLLLAAAGATGARAGAARR